MTDKSSHPGPLVGGFVFGVPICQEVSVAPRHAAHEAAGVVAAIKWRQGAGIGVGQHKRQRRQPGGTDDLQSVRFGLPRPGGQRSADGAVAFQRDGH